jgi:3-isopropylmalate/(R)-2-methylmalate dehydratase small subunit
MKQLRQVTGTVAVLDRPDVDTDQIMPKQFLKRIERSGFGEFLFFDWRKDPDFELNRPEARGARILVAGRNFGCGSSREHAAWGLQDYGFDVVIAPSFGDIFYQNSLKIGLLPIRLAPGIVRELAEEQELTVDLERQRIRTQDGHEIPFELEPHARHCILEGLDDVGLTLQREDEIAAFEQTSPSPVSTTAAAA